MTAMPWFRVYSEILDDRKLKRICKKTGHSKALVIGTWTCLLALANNATPRGELSISEDIPYTIDDLEDELGLPSEIIHQLVDEFKAMGMMNGKNTLQITNWEKRQFKSDNSTERVRRFREKEAEEVKRYDETLQKRAREEQIQNREELEENREDPPSSGLEAAFVAATQMNGLTPSPKKAFQAYEVMEKAGVLPQDVTAAVRILLKGEYTIVGPSSIVNTAITEKTRRVSGNISGKESTMEMLDRQLEELGGLDYGK